MNFRGRARSRPARGKCPKALRKRRPIAAYKQFPKERGGMQGQGSADERQSKPRWVEIEQTRPTERPRDTQGMGQTYLADRPRRPARARSEIAGSDRAVVCGPPLSACARSWAAAAAAAAAAAVQIRRMALPLSTMFTPTEGRQTISNNRVEKMKFRNQLHATRDRVESYRMKLVDRPLDRPASP